MITQASRDALASLDDDALFDALASGRELPELGPEGEPPSPEPTPQDTPLQDTPLQDTPPATPPAPEARAPAREPGQPQAPQPVHVPLSELLSERERRQALARELDEYRRRDEEARRDRPAPDVFENPSAAIRHEVAPVLEPVQSTVMALTREVAELRYSPDEVAAAETAFNEAAFSGLMDPAVHQRINTSPNPFAAAVTWHRQQKVLSEVGNDLDAFRQREREAALQDPEFLRQALDRARAQAQPRPVIDLPGSSQPATLPSVSRMGAAAPISQTRADAADDDTLWEMSLAGRKRA